MKIGNNDNDLIKSIISEPLTAAKNFEELVNRYKNYVFNICYSKLKNAEDAEDATQEVFVRVYFGLNKFRFESEFKTWLTQIAINVCLTMLLSNKQKFWRNFVAADGDVDVETIYRSKITNVQEENFWTTVGSILHKMYHNYRKVFILKYFKNLKLLIISKKVAASVSAVKMRLKRAKDQFIRIYRSR